MLTLDRIMFETIPVVVPRKGRLLEAVLQRIAEEADAELVVMGLVFGGVSLAILFVQSPIRASEDAPDSQSVS